MFHDFKSEIKLFLIVAAVSAIIVVGGILLLQAGLGPSSPAPSPTPSPQSSNEQGLPRDQAELDFAGWQTYRSEEFGFEVKYPEDWVVESDRITEIRGSKTDSVVTIIEADPEGLSFDEWMRAVGLLADNPLPRPLEEYAVTINGARGYRFDTIDEYDRTSEVFIENPNAKNFFAIYVTSTSEDYKITAQILATFRFVE